MARVRVRSACASALVLVWASAQAGAVRPDGWAAVRTAWLCDPSPLMGVGGNLSSGGEWGVRKRGPEVSAARASNEQVCAKEIDGSEGPSFLLAV
eukprot:420774-Pleurochrysis_carterae.AAC.1